MSAADTGMNLLGVCRETPKMELGILDSSRSASSLWQHGELLKGRHGARRRDKTCPGRVRLMSHHEMSKDPIRPGPLHAVKPPTPHGVQHQVPVTG
jgi:hypothetical protein